MLKYFQTHNSLLFPLKPKPLLKLASSLGRKSFAIQPCRRFPVPPLARCGCRRISLISMFLRTRSETWRVNLTCIMGTSLTLYLEMGWDQSRDLFGGETTSGGDWNRPTWKKSIENISQCQILLMLKKRNQKITNVSHKPLSGIEVNVASKLWGFWMSQPTMVTRPSTLKSSKWTGEIAFLERKFKLIKFI